MNSRKKFRTMNFILIALLVIFISFGISAYLWGQLTLAIIFGILLPSIIIYLLVSRNAKYDKESSKEKQKKSSTDNYFYPVEKND